MNPCLTKTKQKFYYYQYSTFLFKWFLWQIHSKFGHEKFRCKTANNKIYLPIFTKVYCGRSFSAWLYLRMLPCMSKNPQEYKRFGRNIKGGSEIYILPEFEGEYFTKTKLKSTSSIIFHTLKHNHKSISLYSVL